jgi:hypothetical protein
VRFVWDPPETSAYHADNCRVSMEIRDACLKFEFESGLGRRLRGILKRAASLKLNGVGSTNRAKRMCRRSKKTCIVVRGATAFLKQIETGKCYTCESESELCHTHLVPLSPGPNVFAGGASKLYRLAAANDKLERSAAVTGALE